MARKHRVHRTSTHTLLPSVHASIPHMLFPLGVPSFATGTAFNVTQSTLLRYTVPRSSHFEFIRLDKADNQMSVPICSRGKKEASHIFTRYTTPSPRLRIRRALRGNTVPLLTGGAVYKERKAGMKEKTPHNNSQPSPMVFCFRRPSRRVRVAVLSPPPS